jgi:hypothetical protein
VLSNVMFFWLHCCLFGSGTLATHLLRQLRRQLGPACALWTLSLHQDMRSSLLMASPSWWPDWCVN